MLSSLKGKIFHGKKAVSDVVATVLMIMITITAATILFYYVTGILSPSEQLEPRFNCLDAQTARAIAIDEACFDTSEQEVLVYVRRSGSADHIPLSVMRFVLNTDSESLVYECFSDEFSCPTCHVLKSGTVRPYYIDASSLASEPQGLTISINDGCILTTVDSMPTC